MGKAKNHLTKIRHFFTHLCSSRLLRGVRMFEVLSVFRIPAVALRPILTLWPSILPLLLLCKGILVVRVPGMGLFREVRRISSIAGWPIRTAGTLLAGGRLAAGAGRLAASDGQFAASDGRIATRDSRLAAGAGQVFVNTGRVSATASIGGVTTIARGCLLLSLIYAGRRSCIRQPLLLLMCMLVLMLLLLLLTMMQLGLLGLLFSLMELLLV